MDAHTSHHVHEIPVDGAMTSARAFMEQLRALCLDCQLALEGDPSPAKRLIILAEAAKLDDDLQPDAHPDVDALLGFASSTWATPAELAAVPDVDDDTLLACTLAGPPAVRLAIHIAGCGECRQVVTDEHLDELAAVDTQTALLVAERTEWRLRSALARAQGPAGPAVLEDSDIGAARRHKEVRNRLQQRYLEDGRRDLARRPAMRRGNVPRPAMHFGTVSGQSTRPGNAPRPLVPPFHLIPHELLGDGGRRGEVWLVRVGSQVYLRTVGVPLGDDVVLARTDTSPVEFELARLAQLEVERLVVPAEIVGGEWFAVGPLDETLLQLMGDAGWGLHGDKDVALIGPALQLRPEDADEPCLAAVVDAEFGAWEAFVKGLVGMARPSQIPRLICQYSLTYLLTSPAARHVRGALRASLTQLRDVPWLAMSPEPPLVEEDGDA